MSSRNRVAVALLTMSLAGFGAWKASEGFTDVAVIPTKGDVPTIGHGSTRWEDGTPVKMGDTITRQRADVLARALNNQAEKQFAASLPGVKLHQEEFDLYMDFVGQYGMGNWRPSSMRRDLLAGKYVQACYDLLKYKFAAGYDCSTPGNKRCLGVWQRQLERHAKCMGAQQ
ncbi:glycoside hydrolase family protein [Pseudomonas sp. SbB1]|uniref:Lysozyme n=1 Tax=Pseudomonas putida (strain GB-1) TaxID=76869 RepID=B0KHE1_PSEPG|nr:MULTISPECIES: glycoside hydrolase family protein [Pseudomonas]ABY97646.1 glycoside hydrolase family 24 [Pseudomonas putida GB-1]MBP0710796.1 glycoside hydrolase family protein [Pseudomonas sp. T34]MCK2190244.1 glycoside hydrolase family protein [Pseudomonas sp. MB04B]MDD2087847.1 glycoside hydrolase family protein [Pseudomonas putida]MDD2097820.1 glycoside hydrolase family protein [Pseudomonas putida]